MFAASTRLFLAAACTAIVCGSALSQDVTSNGSVRLAVGNQPGDNASQVVQTAGPANSGSSSRPRGLLERLRAIGGGVSQEYHEPEDSLQSPPPADWTGIPYHEPKQTSSNSQSQPISDPSRVASRSRSGSSVAVSPRSTASPSATPSTVAVPVGVGRIPKPPAEVSNPAHTAERAETRSSTRKPLSDVSRPDFSPTYSSRRSNRRPVEPLSDAVASPSDRSTSLSRSGSLENSTRNRVLDVEREEPSGPSVQQRPLPERRSASSENVATTVPSQELSSRRSSRRTVPQVASHPDRSTGGTTSETSAKSQAPAATPPSLAVDRSSTATPARTRTGSSDSSTVDSSRSAVGSSSRNSSAFDVSKPPSSQQQIEAAPAVGSGVQTPKPTAGVSATAKKPSGFRPRHAESPDDRPIEKEASAAKRSESGFRSEVPAIRVVAAGPSEIMIRQETPYEIQVENRGSIDAPGVLVRAQLPGWARLLNQTASAGEVDLQKQGSGQQLIWQIEHLAAGATQKLSLELRAEQSGTFEVNVDWTLLPRKDVMRVNVREPKLQLVIEGPDQVVFGESETYRVRVLNPGNGMAPNVVFTLSPNSATPQTQAIGSIPAGKEAEFEVDLTARDLGMLEIHGLATGDLALRTEETKKITVAAAELEATLAGPPLKYQNGEATYELQLRNTGSAASRNVQASLQMASGLKYVGGLDEATIQKDTLTWTIDQLAVEAVRKYQIRCQMAATGTHRVAFQCQGTAAGKAAVSIDTKVEALADLVLSINDPPAPAPVGKDVTYDIVIRNRGSKAATQVKALTHFSDDIEPIRVEGHHAEVTTGQVAFAPIDRIDPGQEIKLRVIAQAEREGLHRFRTEISSADTVLVAEEATRYLGAKTEQISRRSSENEIR